MKSLKGYIFSRPFLGERAPQHIQNIVLREQILIKLGKKAVVGSNQYQGQGITNKQLATQLGISRRIYSYKKQVANLKDLKIVIVIMKLKIQKKGLVKNQKVLVVDYIQRKTHPILFL